MTPVITTDPQTNKLETNEPNVNAIKTYSQTNKQEINGPNVYAFKGAVSPYPIALDFAIVIL